MNILYCQPPHNLKKYIRYFWSCDLADDHDEKVIYFDNYADKHPRLVFQVDGLSPLKFNGINIVPPAYLCGIETVPSTMSVQSNFSHFGISFTSFALADIFNVESELLVNQIIDLNDLGYNKLIVKLANAYSHYNRIEIMCKFIDDQIHDKNYVHQNVIQIVLSNELMTQGDLYQLQKKYKTSERTMERLFKKSVGISPKTFQQLVRLEHSFELLKNPIYHKTADVGHLLNYTDQSHFIKDFKKFTHITPLQFQKIHFLLSESSAFISKI